ncbi:MAG: hypothetical protein AAF909_09130 [Pseudomonadota bacterium]
MLPITSVLLTLLIEIADAPNRTFTFEYPAHIRVRADVDNNGYLNEVERQRAEKLMALIDR